MLEEKLKKIRAQIKFGRAVEATQALETLISDASIGELPLLLPLYVDVLMKRHRFKEAEVAIERAQLIGVSDELHSLREKLEQCRRELSKTTQVANYDGFLFRKFIEGIPELFRTGNSLPIELGFMDVPRRGEVARYAHDQNVGRPYYSWNAVRTQAAKEVYSHCYDEKIDISRFNSEFFSAIETVCSEKLPETAMLFFDDIFGDLVEIARGLLVGVTPPLHQVMKTAYEAHLFPCGWKGDYPVGQLLVHRLW